MTTFNLVPRFTIQTTKDTTEHQVLEQLKSMNRLIDGDTIMRTGGGYYNGVYSTSWSVYGRVETENSDSEYEIAKRYNKDKVDFTIIPIDALEEEARVWMVGEDKYGRDNWEKFWGEQTVNSVMASLLRHSYAILKGEVNDTETGYQHAAHIRCNAAMLIRYFNNQK